jgi:hypothetical protein
MLGSISGMWKRSYGSSIETPPDERGGHSCDEPTATAPHLDFTAKSSAPLFKRFVSICAVTVKAGGPITATTPSPRKSMTWPQSYPRFGRNGPRSSASIGGLAVLHHADRPDRCGIEITAGRCESAGGVHDTYMDASRCARSLWCDDRQIRLQVYIWPVLQTEACGP